LIFNWKGKAVEMPKKMTKEELEALFEECREEIREGRKCDAIEERGWIDPVELALSTNISHYLAGKTMEILSLEIDEELKKMGFVKEKRKQMIESLYGYALIQRKEDLSLGRYIRWISVKNPTPYEKIIEYKLTNGAFLVDIQKKKEGDGWYLLSKNWQSQFIKFSFEPGMVFQQLNRDEIMVMLLSSNL
jgi:hypothetical protein